MDRMDNNTKQLLMIGAIIFVVLYVMEKYIEVKKTKNTEPFSTAPDWVKSKGEALENLMKHALVTHNLRSVGRELYSLNGNYARKTIHDMFDGELTIEDLFPSVAKNGQTFNLSGSGLLIFGAPTHGDYVVKLFDQGRSNVNYPIGSQPESQCDSNAFGGYHPPAGAKCYVASYMI